MRADQVAENAAVLQSWHARLTLTIEDAVSITVLLIHLGQGRVLIVRLVRDVGFGVQIGARVALISTFRLLCCNMLRRVCIVDVSGADPPWALPQVNWRQGHLFVPWETFLTHQLD